MPDSAPWRDLLANLLDWRSAHATLDDAVRGFPPEHYGTRPHGLPYSAWELVEHIRIAQHDILDFCRNPQYAERDWPADYWPDAPAPPDPRDWAEALVQIRADRQAMQALASDPQVDLFAEIPHGDGQTYLREVLLVADHTAYHVGQIVLIRRLLDAWSA